MSSLIHAELARAAVRERTAAPAAAARHRHRPPPRGGPPAEALRGAAAAVLARAALRLHAERAFRALL